MKRYYWEGYSRHDQYRFGNEVLPLINGFGDILSINRFSDLVLGLLIEIGGENINALFRALSDHLAISGYEEIHPEPGSQVSLSLTITFVDGTGDVRIKVPDVPG